MNHPTVTVDTAAARRLFLRDRLARRDALLVPGAGNALTARIIQDAGFEAVYVTGAGEIASVAVGPPDHAGSVEWARNRNRQTWHSGPVAPPAPDRKEATIASLGDGTWTLHHERDEVYEDNNYDTRRYPGRMSSKIVADPELTIVAGTPAMR